MPYLDHTTNGLNIYGNGKLKEISFVSLKEIENSGVNVYNNKKMKRLSFPVLKTIHGRIYVANSKALERLDFPALTSCTKCNIQFLNLKSIKKIELDKLKEADS